MTDTIVLHFISWLCTLCTINTDIWGIYNPLLYKDNEEDAEYPPELFSSRRPEDGEEETSEEHEEEEDNAVEDPVRGGGEFVRVFLEIRMSCCSSGGGEFEGQRWMILLRRVAGVKSE
jgi:hypothetical protein